MVGGYLLDRLSALTELPIVGEVRGVGMMLALELVSDKATRTPLDGRRAVTTSSGARPA